MYRLLFYLHIFLTALKPNKNFKGEVNTGNISAKNIAVMMLEDLYEKFLLKMFNKKEQYRLYFGEDHVLYKILNEETDIYYYKYQDEKLLIHDRNTTLGYRSGNSPLYSAFLDNLKVISDKHREKILSSVKELNQSTWYYILTKRYFDNDKPDSTDNILAHIHWMTLLKSDLENANWYYNEYFKENHTWTQFLIQSIEFKWKSRNLTGSNKRNYWHEHDLPAVGKLANLLTWQYRYYAIEMYKRRIQ